eukprot:gb/GFBE01022949.1/.p1 GENE.gb/GFBE01022949.1/~~gb/GFBE01022949.1/.p1  ORF type:complete len:341 (+),score=64.07 gb/GFBE01022949.1/:1-1023(+)
MFAVTAAARPCAGLLGRFCTGRAAVLIPARLVGTQTPLWRERQEAIAKVHAARRTLQKLSTPPTGLRCNLRSPGELLPAEALPGISPQELAESAFTAAEQGEEIECASKVWALKELPRSADVRQAIDALLGKSRRTLLQEFSARGLERPVSMLLDMSANVMLKDEKGRTALHMAALRNHGKVAQLLLSRGRAHVQARDCEGRTPLHLASDKGNKHVARVLIRFGADPSAVDGKGATPIEEKLGRKGGQVPNRPQLVNWMKTYVARREKTTSNLGKVRYFKGLDAQLPSHVVAPKLVLTPVGYCPEEDGQVVQLKRGIRQNKRRRGPSAPSCKVNWYSPRG